MTRNNALERIISTIHLIRFTRIYSIGSSDHLIYWTMEDGEKMNITIKHAGRKATIHSQSNGIPIAKVFDVNGNFLRSRTFPNMDQAVDFSVAWLYDMEDSRVREFDRTLYTWNNSATI